MTSKEIRESLAEVQKAINALKHEKGSDEVIARMVQTLVAAGAMAYVAEVACQLADLNAQLAAGHIEFNVNTRPDDGSRIRF